METLQVLQQNLPPFALDILRLGIWLLLLMMIFIPLEKLFAETPQNIFRKGLLTDLCYYFLNNLLPKTLLVLPVAVIAWGLRHVVPSAIHLRAASLPLGWRLAAALVVGEFGFYWGHRWTHEIPFLWRFHSVHHAAEEIDWLVNTHAHPLDMVFVRLCGFVPLYALGLAQPTAGNRLDVVPLLLMLVAIVWGFFIHANVRWRFGWLEWLVSTPNFHHWHHTNDEHVNKNYASMLPGMDLLFGTAYMPKKKWPPKYGINGPMPSNLLGQLLHPFVPEDQPRRSGAAVSSTGSVASNFVSRPPSTPT